KGRRAAETRLRCRLTHADVEYVASSNYQASIVRGRVAATVFSSSVEDDVHVAIAVNHLAPILSIVLQLDCHVAVHLADEKVEWLSRWFHAAALSRLFGLGITNSFFSIGVWVCDSRFCCISWHAI